MFCMRQTADTTTNANALFYVGPAEIPGRVSETDVIGASVGTLALDARRQDLPNMGSQLLDRRRPIVFNLELVEVVERDQHVV